MVIPPTENEVVFSGPTIDDLEREINEAQRDQPAQGGALGDGAPVDGDGKTVLIEYDLPNKQTGSVDKAATIIINQGETKPGGSGGIGSRPVPLPIPTPITVRDNEVLGDLANIGGGALGGGLLVGAGATGLAGAADVAAGVLAEGAVEIAKDVLDKEIKTEVGKVAVKEAIKQIGKNVGSESANVTQTVQNINSLAPEHDSSKRKKKVMESGIHEHPLGPRIEGNFVANGDNTVLTHGLSSNQVATMRVHAAAAPNYIQRSSEILRDRADAITVVANDGVHINSNMFRGTSGGGVEQPVNVDFRVLNTVNGALPGAQRVMLDIIPGVGEFVGRVDPKLMQPFLHGGLPSERVAVSAFQPLVRLANINAARALTTFIESSKSKVDNMLIYAKLLHTAMLYDLYAAMGTAVVPVAFVAADAPIWVDITNNALDYNNIADPIESGRLQLLEGYDYVTDDLQVVYWLAQVGHLVDGGVAPAQVPVASYINWPRIPITIFGRGAQPAPWPIAVAQLSAVRLMNFAQKLARSRMEMPDLIRGLYFAMDLMGTQFHANGAAGVRRPCTPYFTVTSGITVAAPYDSNILLRAMGLYAEQPKCDEKEWEAYTVAAPITRTRLVALYVAALNTFTTTALYSLNITAQHVINWLTNANVPPQIGGLMMTRLAQTGTKLSTEAWLYQIPRDMFVEYMGVTVLKGTYKQQTWNPNNAQANAAAAFGGVAHLGNFGRPLRLGNPLAIDRFLLMRPQEWGILGLNTTVDIRAEVVTHGPAAEQGWFAYLGSNDYTAKVSGPKPHHLTTYGVWALNAIVNELRPAAAQIVERSTARWAGARKSRVERWAAPAVDLVANYLPALTCFEPCTVLSYDFDTQMIEAPAITGANLGAGNAIRLSNMAGQVMERVGYLSPVAEEAVEPFDMGDLFDEAAMDPTNLPPIDEGPPQAQEEL